MNDRDPAADPAPGVPVDPHRIVVAVDGSDDAQHALRWALAEAIVSGLPVTALTVASDPMLFTPFGWSGLAIEGSGLLDGALAVQDKALARALEHAPDPAPPITRTTALGSTTEALVQASRHAELLVVGTRRLHGLFRWLGSVSDQVVRHAACPVAVIPDLDGVACPAGAPILVGHDGSPNADAALAWAAAEARRRGVPVRVVAAWSFLDQRGVRRAAAFDPDYDEQRVREALQEAVERVLGADGAAAVELDVVCDLPAAGVLDAAERAETPLLVLGARGVGGFTGLLLGSVANRVLVSSPRPVVIVRAGDG